MRKFEIHKVVLPAFCVIVATCWASVQAITVTSPETAAGSVPPGAMTLIKETISIPSVPKVGETFEVTLTVASSADMEHEHFGPDYLVGFTAKGAVVTQGARHQFSGYLKQGEIRTFKATMLIESPRPSVDVEAHIKTRGWSTQSLGFTLSLLDSRTGRYGLAATRQGPPPAEYHYSRADGQFTDPTPPGSVNRRRSSVLACDNHRHHRRGHHSYSYWSRKEQHHWPRFTGHHHGKRHGCHAGHHGFFRVTIHF